MGNENGRRTLSNLRHTLTRKVKEGGWGVQAYVTVERVI